MSDGREERRKLIRAQLDSRYGVRHGLSRIGRLLAPVSRQAKDDSGGRFRFGVGLLGVATFLMFLINLLPDDGRRWMFAAFAFTLAAVGAWNVDRANRT